MSFIAAEPASAPTPSQADTVTNDGFFPDIALQRLRDTVRLDGTVTAIRLRDAVVDAVIHVNDELADWKTRLVADGVAAVADLLPRIDGESVQLRRYLTAIYRTVKADLNEKFGNFDATAEGVKDAAALLQLVDAERRAAKWVIRDILGVNRTTVELI